MTQPGAPWSHREPISARRYPRAARSVRSCMPRLGWLEDRTLLAGPPAAAVVNVPAVALQLPLGSAVSARIAPLGATYYQITLSQGGELSVTLQAPGFPARVSIVDQTGQPLVQSDASVAGAGSIDENVSAGIDFVEVQSLGAQGTYQITAQLMPADPPFSPIQSEFANVAPIGMGDFFGNGFQDLVAPDGIHVGVGDGTFQSAAVDGPLADSGWNVTAIAVGNFGPSNLPDIAFTETSPLSPTATLCVLQNNGSGQFRRVDTFMIAPHPDAITTLDLGNGIVDLAVADQRTGGVATFVGEGNGGFAPGPILPVGSDPVALASGQFGDGYVDLVAADQGDSLIDEGPELTVFQCEGPGEFRLSATIPLGATPSALAVGNFGNGNLDLAIANDIDNDVSVLLGNGNGTFQPTPSIYPVGINPVALAAYSLRANGVLDLVVVNKNSDDISVLLGNGDGTFQPQARFDTGSLPDSLVVGDFNGDGRPDLAIGNLGDGTISVLLGRGDGTFQDQLTNPVGDDPMAAVSADLNDDGYLDLITTDYFSNDITVLLGNGDGSFQTPRSYRAGVDPVGLVVGDFNGDGWLDVAVADAGDSSGNQGVSILMGNGDGTFQSPAFYPMTTSPSAIVAGDFKGNGVLDLAVAALATDNVTIFLGDGRGGFLPQIPIPIGDVAGGPVSIAAGNFTGDGTFDLAVANEALDTVSILQGNGQGEFRTSATVSLGGDPLIISMALVAGDFTDDTLSDIAVATASLDEEDGVSIIDGSSQDAFAVNTTTTLGYGAFPTSITTGDFVRGGPLDLAVADAGYDQISLLEGDGTGAFDLLPSAVVPGGAGTPSVVATGDFSGEPEDDLAIVMQNPNNVVIELDQGNGQFSPPNAVGLVPRNTPVVADFTGDGVPDVAIVNGSGKILFRQGVANEPGSFLPPIPINNPETPSRDIAAVTTSQGILLASVDATDNAVTLYAYQGGQFTREYALSTGPEPAQIVAADLDGTGDDDLIIRNAGDGSLTIYMSNPLTGGFLPAITRLVGSGVSDISAANINWQNGPRTPAEAIDSRLSDIVLANQTSGEVEVIDNLGDGVFGQPTLYRAGVGLSAVVAGSGMTPQSIESQDGTIGVAAVSPDFGVPPDIVALDAGANTLGVLTGLGDARFANPYSLPTTGTTLAVRVADLTENNIDDLAILGADGVTIWLGNGQGGFVQGPTYNVGPDPTGLTVANLDGSQLPDLVIGNAYGDLLVLLNEGDGLFQPPALVSDSVTLAATNVSGSSPTFFFSDQSKDRVVAQSGTNPLTVLAERETGLILPGAPVPAFLGNNGLEDLIFVNSGGNDVVVLPGQSGGGFGPALDFPVGTDPVAVIVANLSGKPNGRQDLLVANKGSNDVSVLLNEPDGNGFTFVPGPRISVGQGPVSLLYGDFYGNNSDELVVSDSGSNNLMMIPSLGSGFFAENDATTVALGQSPGQLLSLQAGDSTDIVALNPNTNFLTLIFGFSTGSPQSELVSAGGSDPVAAVLAPGVDGYDDLVVADNADGHIAFLVGSPEGLSVQQVFTSSELLSPTGLFFASQQNNSLEVYASNAGDEAAILVGFSLGGLGGAGAGVQGLTLLPASDLSLPLVATLLTPLVNLNATPDEPGGSAELDAEAVAISTTSATSLGQGPFTRSADVQYQGADDEGAVDLETDAPPVPEKAGLSPWKRLEIGLDEAFEEFRRATQPKTPAADRGDGDKKSPVSESAPPKAPSVSAVPAAQRERFAIVDAAVASLVATVGCARKLSVLDRAIPEEMTRIRLEPCALDSIAFVLLQFGLAMAPQRATRHSRPARRIRITRQP
jgi:FG-GAP-like repeat